MFPNTLAALLALGLMRYGNPTAKMVPDVPGPFHTMSDGAHPLRPHLACPSQVCVNCCPRGYRSPAEPGRSG